MFILPNRNKTLRLIHRRSTGSWRAQIRRTVLGQLATGMRQESRKTAFERRHAWKVKRRDLLTPHIRHWHALHGTLSGTPSLGRASKRRPWNEIASFDVDSSRSYATVMLLESIIRLFQPPNHEPTVLLGLSTISRSNLITLIMGHTEHKSRPNCRKIVHSHGKRAKSRKATPHLPAIMPLAKSKKCRGLGGGAPRNPPKKRSDQRLTRVRLAPARRKAGTASPRYR